MTAPRAQVAVLMTLMRQLQETMRTENGLLRELQAGAACASCRARRRRWPRRYELELRRLAPALRKRSPP